MSDSSGKTISLQTLPELRRQTDSVSNLLKEQLVAHLETLRPLFAPERLFGKFAAGKIDVPGAERLVAEIQQRYKKFETKPFDLSSTFETNWIALAGSALEVQPWSYQLGSNDRAITMASPVKWVLAFKSSLPLANLKALLASKETARLHELRQTVVNALLLQIILERFPGIIPLFADLRFALSTETLPDLPGVPITTVTSCLSSFCPPEELVQQVTAFSGVPSFIELIDVETLRQPRDPLRDKIANLIK